MQHFPFTQPALQHSLMEVQAVPGAPQQKPPAAGGRQRPLQHRLLAPAVQEPPRPPLPFGMHIGVVVEVVLVDVEVVGVVVEVLVEVLVVLLVDVLVEVVLVVVVVVPHRPGWSPWSRWRLTALWETSMVFSSGVPGLWQMITFS